MKRLGILLVLLVASPDFGFVSPVFGQGPLGDLNADRYDGLSLGNPYGAGSRYKSDGLLNPYSRYGSRWSDESWRNPYGSRPPRLTSGGRYYGELSVSRYGRDSVSNGWGRYGSRYSPESIRNRYGAGNRYSRRPMYVWPGW